ncbi:protein PHYTOCHROME KINASE SUBSTRATE 4 [Brachypodium distachyon]|uniref:Protein PHYTOCHROME KINASE SUBSTRATE 4 n=1 Tax=Brachypodium distachyon TaxID=15368 RepID=A0A0Q3ITM5_BRADI|nr:protein PHYTOCHROME KINASE SUBSTRATE 4 [Brachypodium distachyon]KQK03772.1 hypothetical protein BRADI_2g09750v3 [Brachypodium distachyon]|eukprot:XP_010230744.2 protein PHYTOCHROME KINASE SUBSTRATE 4 [Brachypodium distachyon]
MDRYRVAPARPVFLSSGATHHHVQAPPPPRRSDGAELDIFTAERYFNAADATKYRAASAATPVPVDSPTAPHLAMDSAASQSGRTAASSEASWNSRSGLLASNNNNNQSASARQQHDGKGGYGGVGVGNGGVVDGTRDERYHRAKKPAGQRWGLFSRVDCPCVGRKAVTVGVASEPPSPRTQHATSSAATDQEISAIFKANRLLLAPPSPTHEPEPSTAKIISTTGSCTFLLRANNNSGMLAPPGPNKVAAFRAPDIGRRVVVSSSGAVGFTFPVIGPATNVVIDEPPRESLEVFRPIDEDSVLLADEPPPRPPSLSAPGAFLRAPVLATAEEDAMSDASSDLFDLESFAASSSYPTTCRGGRGSSRRNSREEDDNLPPYAEAMAAMAAEPALSECMYAPSEASVVWSVATAEGFAPYDAAPSVANFSSAASACGADDFARFVVQPPAAGGGGFTAAMSRSAAGRKKGGGGFLNSCRCEKAVSVGPTPVRVARPRPPVPEAKTAMAFESGGAARYHHGRVHMPVRT